MSAGPEGVGLRSRQPDARPEQAAKPDPLSNLLAKMAPDATRPAQDSPRGPAPGCFANVRMSGRFVPMKHDGGIEGKGSQSVFPVLVQGVVAAVNDLRASFQKMACSLLRDHIGLRTPVRILDGPHGVSAAEASDCDIRAVAAVPVKEQKIEYVPGLAGLIQQAKHVPDAGRQRDIVLENRGAGVCATGDPFDRLPMAEVAGDHAVSQRPPPLTVPGVAVDLHPVLVPEFAPVNALKEIEFDAMRDELFGDGATALLGPPQGDDDAFHAAHTPAPRAPDSRCGQASAVPLSREGAPCARRRTGVTRQRRPPGPQRQAHAAAGKAGV